MTTTLDGGVRGLTSGHPALPRLVAGDLAAFAEETWGTAPKFSRAAELPAGFRDLFTAEAVDELIATRGLRTPFLRVAKDGATLPSSAFTAGGGVGASVTDQVSDDKVLRLFAEGATMVLQGLHRIWPPLIDFAQHLAAELGHPVQINAYVTPPQSRGFADHYDVHDVFVVQIDGEKQWRIHAPVHVSPLRDQPWTDRRADVEAAARTEPLLDVVLRPGDCLYLPRGYLHAATARGDVSTHLTIGVHTWTGYTIAEQILRQALDTLAGDAEVRASLRLGVDVADPADLEPALTDVRSRVRDALLDAANCSATAVAGRLAVQDLAAQRAAPVAPLAQLRTAAAVDGGHLSLRLREHLRARLDVDDEPVLHSRAGDVRLSAADEQPVRELLAAGTATAEALGAHLARRLLLAGIVVADPAP